MSEARQLEPLPREPSVKSDELDVLGLPPLPPGPKDASPMAVSAHAPSRPSAEITHTAHSRALQSLDKASHKALIFLVIGLVSFVIGIGAAAAVVTGALDLQTGWVKEALSLLKQAAKFVLSK
jgi:hypothetical protein